MDNEINRLKPTVVQNHEKFYMDKLKNVANTLYWKQEQPKELTLLEYKSKLQTSLNQKQYQYMNRYNLVIKQARLLHFAEFTFL